MNVKIIFIAALLLIAGPLTIAGQGFLHAQDDRIVDGSGENFIIRSAGTGNWMIQEGYMMKTSGVAGTQHAFREKLIETIGVAKTDSFYSAWLSNHMTRTDIDSMAAWGFNAIRPALHYKWFTLPIEAEPVAGEHTWLETGFELLDSLVEWCADNQMYVILDMHGAPGGQGENADISDYDPSKPSLWESDANKTKLVAVWRKLAERYADEPWIGGYDLINETNWEFDEANNAPLRRIYQRITDTIRAVDTNHILFIEGNWFANDFSGLVPPWDDNMVYSFHKYWSYNDDNSLDYATWLREDYNVPLWLGETGENSNTWFTNLVALAEKNNIGWSFWPIKKGEPNNILNVEFNEEYLRMVDSWRGQASPMDTAEAFEAVMKLAENHRFENCRIQYDVIDAMFRQPFTSETIPFHGSPFVPGEIIFFTDYDLGRNRASYLDSDSADYHGDTDIYTTWNAGYAYRNDAVDIQGCSDTDTTNGYNVGWTAAGEWMVYSMYSDSAILVDGEIRYAGASGTASLVFEVDGEVVSGNIQLPATGGWQTWKTVTFDDLLLPEGAFKLKIRITKEGVNLNYFRFTGTKSASEAEFAGLYCETGSLGNDLFLHLNKDAGQGVLPVDDFALSNGSDHIAISEVKYAEGSSRIIHLIPAEILPLNGEFFLDYNGSSVVSGDEEMKSFQDMPVANFLAYFPTLPARIEAEDFKVNNGFVLEVCEDVSGGFNTGYADYGDYLDYLVYVPEDQKFQLSLRTAVGGNSATVRFYENSTGAFAPLGSEVLTNTGGWQNWEVQKTVVDLPGGKYLFRIRASGGAFNLNWFQFSPIVSTKDHQYVPTVNIYPNPAGSSLYLDLQDEDLQQGAVVISDPGGRTMISSRTDGTFVSIDLEGLSPGLYILTVHGDKHTVAKKFLKK